MSTLVFFIFFTQNALTNFVKSTDVGNYNNTFKITINDYTDINEKFDNLVNQDKSNIKYIRTVTFIDYTYYYSYIYNTSEINVSLGRTFTEEEIKNGEKVVIAQSLPYDPNAVGDIKIINGEEYKVIGLRGVNYYLPFNSIEDKSFINYIEIELKDRMEEKDLNILIERVNENLPCNILVEPNPENNTLRRFFTMATIIILSIGVINMLYLYKVILDSRLKTLGLFRIYGFTKLKTILYIYFELLIFLLISIILGVSIYSIVSGLSFESAYYINKLKLKSYAFTVFACLVTYTICFIPVIKRFVLETPLNTYLD
ncbi:MAG: ABC transporter permease [Clostridia bacterium]|nr:ABC transporter permease [Clostridia bacterium]